MVWLTRFGKVLLAPFSLALRGCAIQVGMWIAGISVVLIVVLFLVAEITGKCGLDAGCLLGKVFGTTEPKTSYTRTLVEEVRATNKTIYAEVLVEVEFSGEETRLPLLATFIPFLTTTQSVEVFGTCQVGVDWEKHPDFPQIETGPEGRIAKVRVPKPQILACFPKSWTYGDSKGLFPPSSELINRLGQDAAFMLSERVIKDQKIRSKALSQAEGGIQEAWRKLLMGLPTERRVTIELVLP